MNSSRAGRRAATEIVRATHLHHHIKATVDTTRQRRVQVQVLVQHHLQEPLVPLGLPTTLRSTASITSPGIHTLPMAVCCVSSLCRSHGTTAWQY